jgi:hypothetical protein
MEHGVTNMKGVGDEVKMLVVIVIVAAIVLFAILLAMGALKPLEELASQSSINNILKIFGFGGK